MAAKYEQLTDVPLYFEKDTSCGIKEIQLSKEGNLICSYKNCGSFYLINKDKSIKCFSNTSPILQMKLHCDSFCSLVVTTHADNTLQILDVETGKISILMSNDVIGTGPNLQQEGVQSCVILLNPKRIIVAYPRHLFMFERNNLGGFSNTSTCFSLASELKMNTPLTTLNPDCCVSLENGYVLLGNSKQFQIWKPKLKGKKKKKKTDKSKFRTKKKFI